MKDTQSSRDYAEVPLWPVVGKVCACAKESSWHAQFPRETAFTSALEGDETSQSWIREAVLSGFNMPRKPVIERRVFGNRHDQVIPTIEPLER